MAQYTVFGSDVPPYAVAAFSDSVPSITTGNYFYPYGAMAIGWCCSGGRVYIPNDVAVANQQLAIKVWKTAALPVDLTTAALESVDVITPVGGGWVEANWDPIDIGAGEYVFIGYAFAEFRKTYYLYATSPGPGFVRSVDDVDLCLAEPDLGGQGRARYLMGSVQDVSNAWYGTDIILTNAIVPPLAAYGFNETSGAIAYDETSNGHNLTLNSDTNFGISREGHGLHQVGGGAGNRITNAATWLETPQRTVMFWGRRGSEGTNTWSQSVYMLDGTGTQTVFGISMNNNANQVAFQADTGSLETITAAEVGFGEWAHYTLTYDEEYLTAYIDGSQIGQVASSSPISASDGNLYFFGGDYQQQVIDDLRFFDQALTQQQIIDYMNEIILAPDVEPPSVPTGLIGNASDQAVVLDWDDSSDNVELQNYIVYRSATQGFTPVAGDQVGGPVASSYTETAPVGTWYYRVAARDAAGNVSSASSEVGVTTEAAVGYFFPSALGWDLGVAYIDDTLMSGGVTLGVLFALSGTSEIAGGRFYSPEPQTGLVVMLYEDGIQVALKTGLDVVTGWNMLSFDTPYAGSSGVDYIVAIFVPGSAPSYQFLSNAPWSQDTSPLSVGPMYSTLSGASRYRLGAGIPNTLSSDWYGVDGVVLTGTDGEIDTTFGATIADENAKHGAYSPEWFINGAGDTGNLGFARQFSVNVGETVDFSCHGTGTVLDIYRIGHYGGLGWRRVATLTNTATSQPDPNVIPDSNGGVECSNWSVTASWTVPGGALSGLFVGIYRNNAQTDASYIPFVVRDDAGDADMVYKTADSTWALAYNYYGTPGSPLTGKSLYGSGGPLGSIGTRTHAVSYHRPIVTREGVAQTYWLACEAPMIRFMERNGINVKYVASRDVDADPTVLNNSNVAISSGHDEYWSDGMRDAFEAYRDSGKNLIFFSGNEVFWRTRFDTERNTMWCYKDSMDGPGAHVGGAPLDPIGWTGTWKDTRYAGRKPEHTLTGTDFRMNGVNDYAVTFAQAASAHPVWRDTALSSGDITVPGIIGFEADEILPTQPVGSYAVLANHNFNIDGKRADDNGAEYSGNGDLNWGVLAQRYESGAVVVGFGTCQWSWGLDGVHDRGSNCVNASMQQATLNLFADLGAEPASVMGGLLAPTPVVSLDVYGSVPISTRSGKIKVWNGSGWNAYPVKYWDGTQWVTRKTKGRTESGWIEGKG